MTRKSSSFKVLIILMMMVTVLGFSVRDAISHGTNKSAPPSVKKIPSITREYIEASYMDIHKVVEPTVVIKDNPVTRYPGQYVQDKDVSVGKTELVPFSEQHRFYIEVNNQFNQKPVQLYTKPSERYESGFIALVPFETEDLKVYNDHFVKVNDKLGNELYVDIRHAHVEPKLKEDKGKKKTNVYNNLPINITFDVNEKTNLKPSDVAKLLEGTNLEGIEHAVCEVEQRYGINAFFTISLAALESGWGSSYLARSRNNLFGIAAYDSNVDAATYFDSMNDCVLQWGELIYEDYFGQGYLTLEDINGKYASSSTWASKVGSIMVSLAGEL